MRVGEKVSNTLLIASFLSHRRPPSAAEGSLAPPGAGFAGTQTERSQRRRGSRDSSVKSGFESASEGIMGGEQQPQSLLKNERGFTPVLTTIHGSPSRGGGRKEGEEGGGGASESFVNMGGVEGMTEGVGDGFNNAVGGFNKPTGGFNNQRGVNSSINYPAQGAPSNTNQLPYR